MKRLAFLAALFFLTTATVCAQDAEELIRKNVEARGGGAAFDAVESIRQEGTATMMGITAPLIIYARRPNKMRSEVELQGMRIVNAFDGETAWMDNPMAGSGPQRAPDSQVEAMQNQSDFDGLLVNHRDRGLEIAFEGEEEVRGAPAYKLRVTAPSGDETFVYLDRDTFLEVKLEREVATPQMGAVMVETHLDDYREVGDVLFPYALETVMNGQAFQQIELESITLNADMPDSLFSFPNE